MILHFSSPSLRFHLISSANSYPTFFELQSRWVSLQFQQKEEESTSKQSLVNIMFPSFKEDFPQKYQGKYFVRSHSIKEDLLKELSEAELVPY